jgi:alpha-2-macroglobulin
LVRAKESGYSKVSENCISKSESALKNIESYYEWWLSKKARWAVKAYSLYVLTILKRNVLEDAKKLFKEAGTKDLSLDGLAFVALAIFFSDNKNANNEIIQEILKHLINNVNETAETANFITSYGDDRDNKLVMLHSDRKVDGIILEMMCNVCPEKQKDLITKITKGLLAHKNKGKWGSTNENLFVLLGLRKYFEVFEKDEPDFKTNCWLDDDWMGETKFKGRETETRQINVEMKYVLDVDIDEKNKVIEKKEEIEIKEKKDEKNLIIEKIGDGRCYYRIGLTYAPKDLILLPRDYGFIVERKYTHVTDPKHVKKKKFYFFKFFNINLFFNFFIFNLFFRLFLIQI